MNESRAATRPLGPREWLGLAIAAAGALVLAGEFWAFVTARPVVCRPQAASRSISAGITPEIAFDDVSSSEMASRENFMSGLYPLRGCAA